MLKRACGKEPVIHRQDKPPGGAPGALLGQRPPFVRRSPKSTVAVLQHDKQGQKTNSHTKPSSTSAEYTPNGGQQARVTKDPCDAFMDIVLSVSSEGVPCSASPDTESIRDTLGLSGKPDYALLASIPENTFIAPCYHAFHTTLPAN